MASLDMQRLRRLLPYLGRDRRRLILSLLMLIPLALAGAIQPLLVGQAISVLRHETTLPWLAALPVEVIHLAGSVELGPITGMSEAIVDLVASGRTLRDNGLIAIEDLFHSTARLVGHPLALRLDDGRLQAIVERIRAVSRAAVPA